ncbi:MAG TPA: ABC transporter substrate-binding protein [Achromobacter sp.]|nr:ABC transporter substrate-binding protein [Achromobacter sp.]
MKLLAGALAAGLSLASAGAVAQAAYPTQAIKFIVPYAAGGSSDTRSRQLAQKLSDSLGVPVVVDNKPGASGNIGTGQIATAKPDGYTILFGTSGPLAINVSLYKKQGYNPETSFAPIIRLGHLPNILVVNPSVPVNNAKELIAYAKQNPDKLSYASSGNGASSHLAGILFNQMAGTKIMHIPYKGTGPALNDLLGGQVSMSFTDILTALPYIKAGKLRAIGLASAQRSDALPDLPTLSEQGLTGYDVSVFFGIVAPKGTPADVVDTLNRAFKTALSDPAIEQTLRSQGIVAAQDQTPQGLAAFITTEVPKWRELIKSANVSID